VSDDMKKILDDVVTMTEAMEEFVEHGLEDGHFPDREQLDAVHRMLDNGSPTGPCEAGAIVSLMGMAIGRMERLGFNPLQMTVAFAQALNIWQEEGGLGSNREPDDASEDEEKQANETDEKLN
jgi:hypothetical protein